MDEIELKRRLIEVFKKDLDEAVVARDQLAEADIEAQVEKELEIEREKISKRVLDQHEAELADATKTVELMRGIINKHENELALMCAENTEEIENEGV